jgi:hypothetical protein
VTLVVIDYLMYTCIKGSDSINKKGGGNDQFKAIFAIYALISIYRTSSY